MLYIIVQARHMDCASVISKRLFLHKLSSSNCTGISEKLKKKNRFHLLIILNISNNVVLYYLNNTQNRRACLQMDNINYKSRERLLE